MSDTQSQVQTALEKFWSERIIPSGDGRVGAEGGIALDSLSACEVLLEIDPIVGFKVPAESVIRKGGYETQEQFVSELTAAILVQIEERAP